MRDMWVDFNDLETDGTVSTLARFAGPDVQLHIGAQLVVGDDDGNVCSAKIVSMNPTNGLVTLALDMQTFKQVGRHARVMTV